MSTQPVLFPVLLAADTDPLVRAVAAYLARFKDATRVHTESDLRAFLPGAPSGRHRPSAQRVHIELYIQWMQEVRRFKTCHRSPHGRADPAQRRGAWMDRHAATRRLRRLATAANVGLPRMHPYMLRHTFVTTMLDAGVDLRDVQIAARHAGPRTTRRYDRARKNLDRHPNYILAAYMASGTQIIRCRREMADPLALRTLSRTLMVEVLRMTAVSATSARANLYRLIDQVNEESEPLTITGQRGNAVLIGEDDWRAIQESLFLAGVPGFAESIRQARSEGIEAGSETLEW